MVKPGKGLKRTVSSGLMYAMFAMAVSSASAATLVFTGAGGSNNFHDAKNWDGLTVPTAADQVTIKDGSSVTISNAAKVGSLRVGKNAVLNLQNALEFISGLNIEDGGIMNVINGTLETSTVPTSIVNLTTYPTITVNGVLSGSGATISGSNETRDNPTLILTVGKSGAVRFSGPTNKLLFVKAGINGELTWGKLDPASAAETPAGEFTLHVSQIDISGGSGKASLLGSSLSRLSAADDSSSVTVSGGSMEIHGNQLGGNSAAVQSIDVPITVAHGQTLTAKAGSTANFIRLGGGLSLDGTLRVEDGAQLVLARGAHSLSSTSHVRIADGAAVYVEGGETVWLGQINAEGTPSGSLVVQAPAVFAGRAAVSELFILGGTISLGSNDLAVDHSPSITVGKQVFMDAGSITGTGAGPRRTVTLAQGGVFSVDGSATSTAVNSIEKSINNVSVVLNEKATMSVANSVALSLGANTEVIVGKQGSIALTQGSSIRSTVTATNASTPTITLGEEATVSVAVGEAPVDVGVAVRGPSGSIIVTGSTPALDTQNTQSPTTQSVTFRRPVDVSLVKITDNTYARIIFDCSSEVAQSQSAVPTRVEATGGDVELHNCVAVAGSGTDWTLSGLALSNSVLAATNGGIKTHGLLQLGTVDGNAGILAGAGTLDVRQVIIHSGALNADTVKIGAGGMQLRGPTEKAVSARMVDIATGSAIDVESGATLSVAAEDSLWHFHPGSKLNVGAGGVISSLAPAQGKYSENSPAESIRPQFWLDQASMTLGDSTGADSRPATVDIFIRNSGGHIQSHTNAHGAVTSGLFAEDGYGNPSSNASTVIGDKGSLTLGSKHGLPLVPGAISGPKGELRLVEGPFRLNKPADVDTITVIKGAHGVMEEVCVRTTTNGEWVPPTSPEVITTPTPGGVEPNGTIPTDTATTLPLVEESCSMKSSWLGADAITTSWAFFGTSIFLLLLSCGLGGFIIYDHLEKKKKDENGSTGDANGVASAERDAEGGFSNAVESRDQE